MNREQVFASPYPAAADRVNAFLRGVYGWMSAGLGITAVTAWIVAATPAIVYAIVGNRLLFWGIVIAQLGIVFGLSARVQHLAPATASMLFIVYSVLTGLTMSVILLAYTGESVATTFMVTAGMFGALAFYGTVTRRDLSGWGRFSSWASSAWCSRRSSGCSGRTTRCSSSSRSSA